MFSTKRCDTCEINYPETFNYCVVDTCRLRLRVIGYKSPDTEWLEKVAAANDPALGKYEPPVIPVIHREDATANVYMDDDGRMWVPALELKAAGYDDLDMFKIVCLDKLFYELTWYDKDRALWWVEEIVVDGAAETLTPEMFSGASEA